MTYHKVLLHISDIHFRDPECNTEMDPDRPYRTRLLQDVKDRSNQIGHVSAILVTGDIAYKGAIAEYNAAFLWLTELAEACGCPKDKILVVPGNHDVDRTVIAQRASVRNAQQAISRAENSHQREQEFRTQFRDPEAGKALLQPINAYNEFAARFSCQLYSPDKLFWIKNLSLDDLAILRIYGLNSILLSGAGIPFGREDRRNSLYLSPLQTVLDPIDGVVNLVMCHHPPDWFMDQDEIEDAVNGRAMIQLFGHKHRQRITREESYVRFSAGAVNPDRNDYGWEPGYNIINLTISQEGTQRFLDIEANLLVWQTNPEMFRPKLDRNQENTFRHRLIISTVAPPLVPTPQETSVTLKVEKNNNSPDIRKLTTSPLEGDDIMGDERTHNLAYRFWNLASSQRREITFKLGLIDANDMLLSEPERYGRAFLRAKERNLVANLAEEIVKRER